MLSRNIQLLLIDDSDQKRFILETRLKQYFGAKVVAFSLTHAKDERQAEQFLREKLFDCIFLDYQMPRSLGPQIIEPFYETLNQQGIYLIGFSQYYFENWEATPEVRVLFKDFLDVGDTMDTYFTCFDKLMQSLPLEKISKGEILTFSQPAEQGSHRYHHRTRRRSPRS